VTNATWMTAADILGDILWHGTHTPGTLATYARRLSSDSGNLPLVAKHLLHKWCVLQFSTFKASFQVGSQYCEALETYVTCFCRQKLGQFRSWIKCENNSAKRQHVFDTDSFGWL